MTMDEHEWIEYSLGDVAPSASNPMPSDNEEVWNLSLREVEGFSGKILRQVTCQVNDLGSAKCCFDSRHVLYSKLRPYLNKVVLPCQPGVGTSELIPMLPDTSRLNRKYLAYYLRSPQFLRFSELNTRGANLPRIAMTALWSHKIPLPKSLQEQARIVSKIDACLEDIDELQILREEATTEIKKLRGAVFADFVETEVSEESRNVLGDVIVDCKYGTSKKANVNEKGFSILRMGNIKDGRLNVDDLKHIELSEVESKKYLLSDGDILINRTNSHELVGKSAVFEDLCGDWVYASYLIRIRVDSKKAIPSYVNAVINSRIGRSYVYRTARRAIGMVNINAQEIKKLPLPLPPMNVQQEVVDRMEETEPLVDELSKIIQSSDISTLRQSVLHKAFAGEL